MLKRVPITSSSTGRKESNGNGGQAAAKWNWAESSTGDDEATAQASAAVAHEYVSVVQSRTDEVSGPHGIIQ